MEITPQLLSKLETLLFIAGSPTAIDRLAKTLEIETGELDLALEQLEMRYRLPESGLMIIRLGDRVQMGTKGENAGITEKLREAELQDGLSRAALETLAVVAYRSPVTRADIDAIRGVNSNFTLRYLLIRGLIEREGNPNDARGYIYRPTFDFLKTLGVEKITDLPEYEVLTQDERLASLLAQGTPVSGDAVESSLAPESPTSSI